MGVADGDLQLFVETIQLDSQTVAELASVPLACRQERSCFICCLGLDTPLLDPGDVHGCVEGFEFRFFCGYGHLTLTNHG